MPKSWIATITRQYRSFRSFGTSASVLSGKNLPPRLKISETDIEENFLKGSGPGGQKINKTSSAVQLKHLPTGIVIKCQETRSREQNREYARRLLADRVEHAQNADESRVSIKAKEAARKRASKVKKAKRKYRKLDEEKQSTEVESMDAKEDNKSDTSGV